ncbi:MAG TPA: type VII secretion protein EccB, partial [Nakamurella sp.]
TGAASTGTVRLAPGTGSLIAERPGTQNTGSMVYLVTDTGVRYPLSGQRAVEALGLAMAPVAQLPPELIAALPVGPTLDPAAAAPAQ